MDFVQEFVLLYAGDEQLVSELDHKMQEYVDSVVKEHTEIMKVLKRQDDIAMLLNTLNDMADLMDQSLGDSILLPNRHYVVKGHLLYLDVKASYRALSLYIRKFAADVYLTDGNSFIAQLGHKDYVEYKPQNIDIITKGKPRVTIGIDISKAEAAGVVLDNFGGKK
jgi:hypothetical protein